MSGAAVQEKAQGQAATGGDKVRTLAHKLKDWAARMPEAPALHRRGKERWETTTWQEFEKATKRFAQACIAMGIERQQSVAIIGRNRPEWLFADLGAIWAGAVPAPIYITNTPEQVAYVVRHCEARVIVAENEDQYKKLIAERANLPKLEKIVLMDDVPGRDTSFSVLWSDFLASGDKVEAKVLEERLEGAKPDHLFLLCYTSGTTGEPKGVMLTHANASFMAKVIVERFPVGRDRTLSYLPLCHVAEHFFTIGAQMEAGNEVFFVDELSKVKDLLPEVRPTLFLAVPRVWEKFEAALKARFGELTGIKAKLKDWALAKEAACFEEDLKAGVRKDSFTRRLADRLFISKVKAKLGIDRVRLAFTGAAPITEQTQRFFAALGLPIYNCYGMTETCALLTTPLVGRARPRTIGQEFPGIEIKLMEDGEICARGPNLTPGYYKDAAQTAALWEGGWLHTGDVGEREPDGYLRITDRKKELFKTSGGKYIAPQHLEARLKTVRGVSQAVAIGDGRKYVAALLTLDPENAPKVAAEIGITGKTAEQLSSDEKFVKHIEACVAKDVNGTLAPYETIKKVKILPKDLSIDGGELTPTMKLRRKIIAQKHAAAIEGLFAGDGGKD